MSVQPYLYTHNDHAGTLLIGHDDDPYLFQPEDGNAYPLSLDDFVDLDTPEAAFLAQADALVGAWREICESVADMPNSDAARQTLRECLDVMSVVIDTETGNEPDPAPALALDPTAVPIFKAA